MYGSIAPTAKLFLLLVSVTALTLQIALPHFEIWGGLLVILDKVVDVGPC